MSILEALLRCGCDANSDTFETGSAPLHFVAEGWETGDNVRALLEAGADIDARTDADIEPFFGSI